jgi:hypothetical protein
VTKPKKKKSDNQSKIKEKEFMEAMKPGQPWISRAQGIKWMIVLSILVAGYMTWNLTPSEGFWKALLWGIGFGASMWAIFYGMQLFRKILR